MLERLVAADSWEAAVFGANDEAVLTACSNGAPPDNVALNAEMRRTRFAGTALPHVAIGPGRRSMFALLGTFGGRCVVIRLERTAFARTYVEREAAAIERFLERHADDVVASISVEHDRLTRPAHDREEPMIFLVDEVGALTATLDEPESAEGSLRAHLMPRAHNVAPVVRPVVNELLQRWHRDGGPRSLNADLPFGMVRLMPLKSRAQREFIVSIELLRSRGSLEGSAKRFSISKRELQVLGAMLRGAPVADIATELSISSSTVVFHLKRMLKKTSSRNRTELAARMLGWESPPA
ncbi:MAG: hypothetical protein NVSMB5_26780 [Candidatus Velthaea sp.]